MIHTDDLRELREELAQFAKAAAHDGATIAQLREQVARLDGERDMLKKGENRALTELERAWKERDILRAQLAATPDLSALDKLLVYWAECQEQTATPLRAGMWSVCREELRAALATVRASQPKGVS